MSTTELTLWSRTNALGEAVLLADSAKQNLIECATCPCDDGALIWDITIGAGETYLFNLELTAKDGAVGHIDWGDQSATRTGLPGTSLFWTRAYECTHTYETAGTYTITVTGDVDTFWHPEESRQYPVLVRTMSLGSFTGVRGGNSDLGCFLYCTNITRIESGCVFGKGFWRGNGMFRGCTKLESIPILRFTIENPVDFYTVYMFHKCTAITYVPGIMFPLTTGNSFGSYGMFQECTALTSIENIFLPASSGGFYNLSYMFRSCTALTTFAIGGMIGEVESNSLILEPECASFSTNYMFDGCTSLSIIKELRICPIASTIDEAEQVVGLNASGMFINCTGLTSVSKLRFPSSPVNYFYSDNMFSGCTSLEEVTSPVSETLNELTFPSTAVGAIYVGTFRCEYMFLGCKSLTSVPILVFPMSVAGVFDADLMFAGCEAITTILIRTFPSLVYSSFTVTSMFNGCKSLQSIVVPDAETQRLDLPFVSEAHTFYMTGMFKDCASLTTIPEFSPSATPTDTTTIAEITAHSMFENCVNLENVPGIVFPNQPVNNFRAEYMFRGCVKLKTVHKLIFPGTIVAGFVFRYTFWNTPLLTSIKSLCFPQTVGGAFNIERMCDSLPNTNNLTELTSLNRDTDTVMPAIFFPETVGGSCNAREAFRGCRITSENFEIHFPIHVGASFTARSFMTGHRIQNITVLTLPATTTSIDVYSAFSSGAVLLNVYGLSTFGNTVDKDESGYSGIGSISANGMFANCPQLKNVTASSPEDSLEDIVEVYLPPALSGMCDVGGMFAGCVSIKKVAALSLPFDGVASSFSTKGMFKGCTSLAEIPALSFPDPVKGGDPYTSSLNFSADEMFRDCTSLTGPLDLSIAVFSRTTATLYGMFRGCTGLTNISGLTIYGDIGTSLNAAYMFQGCSNLESVGDIAFGVAVGSSFNSNYMFNLCSKLQTVGEIKSTATVSSTEHKWEVGGDLSCALMFHGCTALATCGQLTFPDELPNGNFDSSYMYENNRSIQSFGGVWFPGYVKWFKAHRMYYYAFKKKAAHGFEAKSWAIHETLGNITFPEHVDGHFDARDMFIGQYFETLSDTIAIPALVGGGVDAYMFEQINILGLGYPSYTNTFPWRNYCGEGSQTDRDEWYDCAYGIYFNMASWRPSGTCPPFWLLTGGWSENLLLGCSNMCAVGPDGAIWNPYYWTDGVAYQYRCQ